MSNASHSQAVKKIIQSKGIKTSDYIGSVSSTDLSAIAAYIEKEVGKAYDQGAKDMVAKSKRVIVDDERRAEESMADSGLSQYDNKIIHMNGRVVGLHRSRDIIDECLSELLTEGKEKDA